MTPRDADVGAFPPPAGCSRSALYSCCLSVASETNGGVRL